MNKKIIRITVTFVVLLAFGIAVPTEGQEFIQPVLRDPYVKALFQVLDTWDAGNLVINRVEVEKDFFTALTRRKEKPISAFERSEQYIPEMTKRWKALPEILARQVPLTPGARMVMAGPLYDHREQLASLVREPNQLQVRLRMEFFVVLASGQLEAISQKKKDIDGVSILRGYSSFWSIPWPFCCWGERR